MKPRKTENISLPLIARKQSQDNLVHRERAEYDEGVAVVGAASGKLLSEENNKQLPESWTQQHLESIENQLTKGDWENQIARHVLSLFASTQARTNLHESTSLLDFVDPEKAHDSTDIIKLSDHDHSEKLEDIHKIRTPQKKSRKIKKEKKSEEHIDPHTKSVVQNVFKMLEKDPLNESKYRTNNTIRVKDGLEIVVRGSPRCYPIWFASTGDVYSDWEQLPGGRELQAQLNVLYEHQKFSEYLDVLETTLEKLWREIRYGQEQFDIGSFGNSSKGIFKVDYSTIKTSLTKKKKSSTMGKSTSIKSDDMDEFTASNSNLNASTLPLPRTAEEICMLWCQLISTANAMGVLTVEKKQYELSLTLFNRAEKWSQRKDIILSKSKRTELKAYVRDSIAYLFFRRAGYVASLSYSQEALESFEKVGNIEAVAGCLSHQATVLVFRGDFKEAHRKLFDVLAMVENGRLAQVNASPKQLCLIAVCYHNLAVVQLKLALPDLACKNSQNARKLARLCLSYSNRWIKIMQYTHEIAINDLKFELQSKNISDLTVEQMELVKGLAEVMFDPQPPV